MPRKSPTIGIGDHVRLHDGSIHLVVDNRRSASGRLNYINKLATSCHRKKFHDLAYLRTSDPITCFECLLEEV